LPEDDLTLATVLKGPFFGIDEETLFELAYDRGDERLWHRLRARAVADPKLRPMAERLSALLARADFVPPYELYAEILGAEGGRRDALPLGRPPRGPALPFYAAERQGLRARQLQEYRRLLYVALSRAQDRLYICGWQPRDQARDASWHTLCRTGLAEIAAPFAF